MERGGDHDPSQNWTVFIPANEKIGAHDQHRYTIEYIEQWFSKDNIASQFDAIGSFVLDKSNGFTQSGIARINDSIRTYVWAILGAQAQTRSSILGKGNAFDAQKQFLANVEGFNSKYKIPPIATIKVHKFSATNPTTDAVDLSKKLTTAPITPGNASNAFF